MTPIYIGLGLLAGATLLLEVSLTRTFSLAQFYHFAFMAVSLALLGFGASGSLLALRPHWREAGWERRLTVFAFTFALTDLAGYLLTNWLPFDSFSIAWDRRQVLYLLLYFLVPALPFTSAGLAIGLSLASAPARSNRLYGANLIGSAGGCLIAVALPIAWGPRAIPLSAGLAAAAGLCFAWTGTARWRTINGVTLGACLLLLIAPPALLEVRLSPYKGLRQALLYPDARIVATWRNAYARWTWWRAVACACCRG